MLVSIVDQAYDRRSWHGPNLRGSIRGVSAEQAAWRPASRRHNIWEIVVHCAYWKYAVRRRLTGEKRGSFELKGSNFFTRPGRDRRERSWKADVALLDRQHRQLRAVIAALPASTRSGKGKGGVTKAWLVTGIAAHDLYHAGQIQLLKRLSKG